MKLIKTFLIILTFHIATNVFAVSKKQCVFQYRNNYLDIFNSELLISNLVLDGKVKEAEKKYNELRKEINNLIMFRNELAKYSKDDRCYLPRSYAKKNFLGIITNNINSHKEDVLVVKEMIENANTIQEIILQSQKELMHFHDLSVHLISRVLDKIEIRLLNKSGTKIIDLVPKTCRYDESGLNLFCSNNVDLFDNYGNTYEIKISPSTDFRIFPTEHEDIVIKTDRVINTTLLLKFNGKFTNYGKPFSIEIDPISNELISLLQKNRELQKKIIF